MTYQESISRRALLSTLAAAPLAAARKKIPVGVELYSVRDQLKQDLMGTVRQVAKLGYDCVEFYSPYTEWTTAYAREVRKLLDDLGMKNFSNHTGSRSFSPENLGHVIELNQIMGSRFIIMSSAGRVTDLDGWKKVAETLNEAGAKMKSAGIRTGFHNHQTEFKPIDGTRPIDVLAKNTGKDVTLQLDVGTCIEAGSDPVVWIKQNPGRITSMHCKEWSRDPAVGYKALLGEGEAQWKEIFAAAEKTGGIEFYLVEQEGSRFEPMDTIDRCLKTFRKVHG